MAALARPQSNACRQTSSAPVRETRGLAGLPGATGVAGNLPMAAVGAEHKHRLAPGQAGGVGGTGLIRTLAPAD